MKLYSTEAEQAVIGGCLIDKDAYAIASDLIGASDFAREDHAEIWRAISFLSEAGNPTDVVTVAERLDAMERLEDVGGLAYLAGLYQSTASAANIKAYAGIIRDRSIRRQTIQAAKRAERAAEETSTAEEGLDIAQQCFAGIEAGRASEGPVSIQSLLPSWLDDMQDRIDGKQATRGLSTGLKDLDAMLSGLCPGRLYGLGGRPSMGKSALAGQIAVSAAATVPVLYWTGEMPNKEVVDRSVATICEVPIDVLESADLSDGQWANVTRGVSRLNDSKLHIDQTPSISVWELRKRARRIKGIGLIVCDYLQLMQAEGENRSQQMGAISRSLKSLAKELNCPVLVVSSLNRKMEERADKRPQMGDLRESGDIEHDLDVCIMVYRAEVYDQDHIDKGYAELIVRKQRGGRIGTVYSVFRGEVCRFENTLERPPSLSMPKQSRGRF